jgi:tight adherence protein B
VQAGLAGARATAAILAGLPCVGVALGELIGAHPVRFLLGGGAGGWLLVLGVGLIGIGVTWSDHIIDRLMP